MEEEIKVLEELIKYWNDIIKQTDEDSPFYNWIKDEKIEVRKKALENLINRNKELEKENADLTSVYIDGVYDGEKKLKDKIKESLGIEEDITDEKILNYIDILVSENNRLEDIEDRKIQIEYRNVFNKGVKSVKDKINAKITYYEELIKTNPEDEEILRHIIQALNETLEELL